MVLNRCKEVLFCSLCASVLSSSSMTAVAAAAAAVKSSVIDSSVIVEFGGVAVPLHQSVRSSTYFAALQCRFHAVHFIDGYRHLLQLWFVEGAAQHFSEIVDQSVHGWIGDVNLVYGEHLFAPIRHVAFFEQSLELTDAHSIGHTELGHALTSRDRTDAATPLLDSLH